MTTEFWTAIDEYICDHTLGPDDALDQAIADCDAADLPPIAVAPNQGKLLWMLARLIGATRILEIGTLGGYSAIWLARALPANGRLTTLEYDPKHAAIARANIERAGLADRVDIRIGAALDTLPELHNENAGPFDLTFIDADKENIPAYFEWALEHTRTEGVIIVDNVVRSGKVIDQDCDEPMVQGVRRFNAMLKAELKAANPRFTATALQTVGSKGHDGFAMVMTT